MGTLVNESLEGLERVSRIVRQLKGVSHLDNAETLETDLNAAQSIAGPGHLTLRTHTRAADDWVTNDIIDSGVA